MISYPEALIVECQIFNIRQQFGAVGADHGDIAVADRDRVGRSQTAKPCGIDTTPSVDRVASGTTKQAVVAGATDQRVVAAAAHEGTTVVVGDQRVVAAAADRLLDIGAKRDADVVLEPADGGEAAGVQVDGLVVRVAG